MSPNPLKQSEKDVERECVKYAKSLGWVFRKQQGMGARGKTDRMFLQWGQTVFVEFKAPGKKPTTKQFNEIKLLHDLGFAAGWFDTIGGFKLWFDATHAHFEKYYSETKICYQCDLPVNYLFPDSRCKDCTRITPEEMI